MNRRWWTARLLHPIRFPDYVSECKSVEEALALALSEEGEDASYPLYAEVRELYEMELSDHLSEGGLWQQLMEYLSAVSQFTDIEAADFPVRREDSRSLRRHVQAALKVWVTERRDEGRWPLVLDFVREPEVLWVKTTEDDEWKLA